ncbi:hypothetical protein [Sphingobacterium sp. LRF_L2]|uniref:hypothetical protein n=1 Tax=Sphingobacterium sp. LRF_L2 TaxID=3369421 RepID=UPI003F5E40FF
MEDLGILIDRLKAMRDGLVEDAKEVSQSMALTHKGVVVKRVQSEGIPGASYSEKGVPAYLVEKSSYARLNSGFDRMIKKKKKSGESVAWKDVRESQGRQTNHVDYTFSGRTLKNLTIVDTVVNGPLVSAYLGANEHESFEKLRFGFARYGNFLAPNDQEKELLFEHAQKQMDDKIKKYKL